MKRQVKLTRIKNTNKVKIKIPFPLDWDTMDKIKQLSNRKFKKKGKERYWLCDFSMKAVEKLENWGFEIDQELENYYNQQLTDAGLNEEINLDIADRLYDFQRRAVSFLESKNGNALIADEQGLGKTIESLSWIRMHPEKRPVLIVCPSSVKINWQRECQKWLVQPEIQILNGRRPYDINAEIVIINYDILQNWTIQLKRYRFEIMITDEAHYYKNDQAKRSLAVKKIAKRIPYFIALTGTPVINRPKEIFNAINIIDSTIFPSWWNFAMKYCGAKFDGYNWDFSGSSNEKELNKILTRSIMLRRLKQDVLHELPDKQISYFPMDIDNRKEYEYAESNFIQWIKETKGKRAAYRAKNAEKLSKINNLKQLASQGKIKGAVDFINDILSTSHKVVIFCIHRSTVNKLMEKYKGIAVKIDGSVSNKNRQKAIDLFQKDENIRVFVGNMQAAGVGITLTASSNVIHLELGWTSTEHDQAGARVHRVSQTRKVNEYYLIATDTIEEKIARIIDNKRQIVDKITDGKDTEQESLLQELMKDYEEEAFV